ncbi:sensor histidine kinase [Varunaivibrio sulfuroxidans]|uniref:histidine kinase n=1 Tax=Varunaivibrio sulfuroxidans TaxID=1773489 RepID=A0A4R3JET7_9PROT|nr:HAMP domain-containing sensor histidine kinase [Varunaivibrio sulfuroxidans]TCS63636.1 signal transduction histidine kinase [Varunaivibrio sulfuroxidans]WES30224.1 HAMP domain-containing sensor histidine kinase [Varunaivibrio sulfuroxidans]
MVYRSVSLRLILGASLWITLTLALSGTVLVGLLRTQVEQSFDRILFAHIEELLALSDFVDGRLKMRRHPADPEYNRPLSGWYWEVVSNGRILDRSRSLWDQVLPEMTPPSRGQRIGVTIAGLRDKHVRLVAETFSLPGAPHEVTIYVTGPTKVIDKAIGEFTEALVTALLLLGFGLIVAVFLQVRYGLRPLNLMRQKLAAVHCGAADRLQGRFPMEVQPLVDDLNGLLAHNAKVIERARTQAGNLAHALKTPLAVLANEADHLPEEPRHAIWLQTSLMSDLIDRHLTRARAAGSRGVAGARADIEGLAQGLARTLKRIYERRDIDVAVEEMGGLSFQGESQDLEEMLGNLMDNACKWAEHLVVVSARKDGDLLVISVDDDGPGIPAEYRARALDRGHRLDESKPGSGLGLSIVLDMAELYGGRLELERSSAGGLSARLHLPAA